MKPIKQGIILQVACLALLLGGCATEETPIVEPSATPKTKATLTLNLPEGGFEAPATKALNDAKESEIETVDVLVFKKTNTSVTDDNATFLRLPETVVASDGQSFRMEIDPDDEGLQQYVVIANARAAIPLESSLTGKTKAEVMELLVMTKTTAWNTGTDYERLPMWGETKFRRVTDAASAAATIDLLRSVARINVEVATAAQADFQLTEVWLYNPSTKGLLAPSNWDDATQAVIAESLPADRAKGVAQGWTTMTEATIALKNSIYTFEAPKAGGNSDEDAACLVVGGKWKGESVGYYRIDFYGGEAGSEDFLPLLRNHRYDVQIVEANGRGYPTKEEALLSGFTALTALTHTWDEGGTGNVIWDGRHYLSVSQLEYVFDPEARSFNLEVGSNYPEGWKAELKDGGSWLTLDSGSSTGDGNKHTLTYKLTENKDKERTATITVIAGRLKQIIKVTQHLNKQLALELGEVEIIFKATAPEAKTLRIEWQPAGTPVAINQESVPGHPDGNLKFNGGVLSDTGTDEDGNPDNGGGLNYTFTPDEDLTLATFKERRSTLKVVANNGVKDSILTVLLRQFDYALVPERTMAGNRYQQLTTYYLTIKSNAQWTVSVDNTTGVLKPGSYSTTVVGDPNYTTGEVFEFTTADESHLGQTATLTFSPLIPGQFAPVDVKVTMWKNEPNSYMVSPGGSVEIPVSKVFDIWAEDKDLNDAGRGGDPNAMNGALTAGLLWQDEQGLISAPPTLTGSGRGAKIQVQTASKSGNAVVYLAVDGDIRWSWHIWVTNYDPDKKLNGTIHTNPHNGVITMDRNLGATSNTAPTSDADVSSLGLLYQWGRKDPFPGRAAMNLSGFNSKAIYDFDGNPLDESTDADYPGSASGSGVKREPTTADYNLANAIVNPLTFYWGAYYPEFPNAINMDWYTGNHTEYLTDARRNDFWGPTYKSGYDPCPDGWRVANGANNGYATYFIQPGAWVDYQGMMLTMGFFPAAGLRNVYYTSGTNQGALTSASNASLWLATSMGALQSIRATSVSTSGTYGARGLPVRCVKTTIK